MKGKLKEFLKPDKRKVALALLLPYLWNLFIYFILVLLSLRGESVLLSPFELWIQHLASSAPIYLVESLIYYFFVCSVLTIYDYWKSGRKLRADKELYELVKIGILIFNPISINVLSGLFLLLVSIAQPEKTGLVVLEVYPESSAYTIINRGDRISIVNDTRVVNTNQVLSILSKTTPSEKIYIYSNGYGREFRLATHENFTRGYLGIKVRDAQGNEAIL